VPNALGCKRSTILEGSCTRERPLKREDTHGAEDARKREHAEEL
jgi:hypothetical protein